MERRLSELWYREDAGPSLLQPLSWLYGALVRARRAAYRAGWLRSRSTGAPVIVIGNLTVGGTGKTPLTIWLARELSTRGFTVGLVARGYGRRGRALRTVSVESDWREVGDEPLLLARRSGCATIVAADRAAGARLLAARGADLILADDGLQHLRLARACEIVVIDGARGFGNGRLLPAGPLREPAGRVLHADIVVVNGTAAHGSLARSLAPGQALTMRLVAGEAVCLDASRAARPLASFRGQRVHAVAGIGNPQRFFGELRTHGLQLLEHAYPDHHPFTAAELSYPDALPVFMTEKDAVKCAPFANARLWYVPVTACFAETDAHNLLARVLAKLPPGVAARGAH